MRKIIVLFLIIALLLGCSSKIKSAREQERDIIKENKPLVDKLTKDSSETDINLALDFCDSLLPDSMEICYIDIAIKLKSTKARQICNMSEAFEYNHHKNQAQCYAEIALPGAKKDPLKGMEICEFNLKTDLIYECYAKLGSLLIEQDKNIVTITELIKQKCDSYKTLFEYGASSDTDACLARTTKILSWLKKQEVDNALFPNCMSMISGNKVGCLTDIDGLEKATNEKIIEYCNEDRSCIAFSQKIPIKKKDFASAIELCNILPSGPTKNDCYIWIVNDMENPEDMLSICENKVTQGRHQAQMSQNKKDVCYTETAERFASQGDIRAAELCSKLPGWRWPCVENIIGKLDFSAGTEVALKACEVLNKETERTRCEKRLD